MSDMKEWADCLAHMHQAAMGQSPSSFHDLGMGALFSSPADAHPAALERIQAAMGQNVQLEAGSADLATLLAAERDRVAQLQRDCEYWKGMAVLHSWKKALAEEAAEDTDAFPDNALKHSV